MTPTLPPPQPPAMPAAPDAPAAPARARRGDRDVSRHLDMAVIGQVCLGVGLAGYRSVLAGFLGDESGTQAALLAALERADRAALSERAHTLKGAAASLGLRAVRSAAQRLESDAAALDAAACSAAAAELRALLATARALLQRLGFA